MVQFAVTELEILYAHECKHVRVHFELDLVVGLVPLEILEILKPSATETFMLLQIFR